MGGARTSPQGMKRPVPLGDCSVLRADLRSGAPLRAQHVVVERHGRPPGLHCGSRGTYIGSTSRSPKGRALGRRAQGSACFQSDGSRPFSWSSLCGFFILGLLAYRTYMAHPPVPGAVVDSQGRVLYTGKDIQKGQQVFLHNGLMEYGSAFGHGAYLGPDYTADYLRRSSDLVRRSYGGAARTPPGARRSRTSAPTATTRRPRRSTLTSAQADAFRRLVPHYSRFFSDPTTEHGLRANAITDPVAAAPADRVLRVDGMGRVDESTRAQLLLHEQLAARAARRQQADRQRRSSGRCCR